MIAEHFPVLVVILPLVTAPICVMLRHGGRAWLLATIVTWASFALAIALLRQVMDTGAISYLLGDWAAPWGIEYRIDQLSAFIILIVTAIGSVMMVFAPKSVTAEIPGDRVYLFYTMYLLTFAGLLGMAATGDAFNLFVFLEISSLSTYVLIRRRFSI